MRENRMKREKGVSRVCSLMRERGKKTKVKKKKEGY